MAPRIKAFMEENFGPVRIEYTDFGVAAHSGVNRENPCFLCSRQRRKKFFDIAGKEGCHKIALGHTKDDIIETFFINILYAGKIGTMKPKQSFFGGDVDIIRPLAYVESDDVVSFGRVSDLPEFHNSCPSKSTTKRSDVRKMLQGLYKENKHVKGNIFNAMGNVATDYLLNRE
jgi:tRNA 2-thiocytidine biosynthesis protein TtcA